LQTTELPPTQTPFWQVSVSVHALPSLQAVPVCGAQLDVAAVQVVHAAHAAPTFCHAPLESHVCGCGPLHCLVVGEHTPVQVPLAAAQTNLHAAPSSAHWPVRSQVCG